MNLKKLHAAQAAFLARYPGGFAHASMQALGKKHKMDQLIALAQQSFSRDKFKDPRGIGESMVKLVGRSSLVSVFEKPQFRDFMRSLSDDELAPIVKGLKAQLFGNQQQGFETLVDQLRSAKLAKWPLLTAIPNYVHPDTEVFIKPTTVKGVIAYFELEGLQYHAQPTWDFYRRYREAIAGMKAASDPSITPSNAAFCGFLMMCLANS